MANNQRKNNNGNPARRNAVVAQAGTKSIINVTAPVGSTIRQTGLGNAAERIIGREPVAVPATGQANIPWNLAFLNGTRISAKMRTYSLYKVRKLALEWRPTVPVTAVGRITGGLLPWNARPDSLATHLPISNGGFIGAVHQPVLTNFRPAVYSDRWRSVSDFTDEGVPAQIVVLSTGGANLVDDGTFVIHYDIEVAEPVGPSIGVDLGSGTDGVTMTNHAADGATHSDFVDVTGVAAPDSGSIYTNTEMFEGRFRNSGSPAETEDAQESSTFMNIPAGTKFLLRTFVIGGITYNYFFHPVHGLLSSHTGAAPVIRSFLKMWKSGYV